MIARCILINSKHLLDVEARHLRIRYSILEVCVVSRCEFLITNFEDANVYPPELGGFSSFAARRITGCSETRNFCCMCSTKQLSSPIISCSTTRAQALHVNFSMASACPAARLEANAGASLSSAIACATTSTPGSMKATCSSVKMSWGTRSTHSNPPDPSTKDTLSDR